jgi:hypothetical protein
MLQEGVEPPTQRQVAKAIEAVMTGQIRAVTGRDRKSSTRQRSKSHGTSA